MQRNWNLNRFYDVGEVYDVWLGEFLPIGAEYHQDNKTFTVTENEASVRYMVRNSEQEWNYMYVYLSQMSDDFMETVIRYYDINGKLLLEQQTTLTEGENYTVFERYYTWKCGVLCSESDGQVILSL